MSSVLNNTQESLVKDYWNLRPVEFFDSLLTLSEKSDFDLKRSDLVGIASQAIMNILKLEKEEYREFIDRYYGSVIQIRVSFMNIYDLIHNPVEIMKDSHPLIKAINDDRIAKKITDPQELIKLKNQIGVISKLNLVKYIEKTDRISVFNSQEGMLNRIKGSPFIDYPLPPLSKK